MAAQELFSVEDLKEKKFYPNHSRTHSAEFSQLGASYALLPSSPPLSPNFVHPPWPFSRSNTPVGHVF